MNGLAHTGVVPHGHLSPRTARRLLAVLAFALVALVALALAPQRAQAQGKVWAVPLTIQACHGADSGGWAWGYWNYDAIVRTNSQLPSWCRFQPNSSGQGWEYFTAGQSGTGNEAGFGWGVNTYIYEATPFRSRETAASGNWGYVLDGNRAIRTYVGNYGLTGLVHTPFWEQEATVLTGGPTSGTAGTFRQTDPRGTANYNNPAVFMYNAGNANQSWNRYIRNSNQRLFANDYNGPRAFLIAASGTNPWDAFNCWGGAWSSFNSNNWCPGTVRFNWASDDNYWGRNVTNMFAGTNYSSPYHLVMNAAHVMSNQSYDSGSVYTPSACSIFRVERYGTDHSTPRAERWGCLDHDNPSTPSVTNTHANSAWHNVASITVNAASSDVGAGVRDYRWVRNDATVFQGASFTLTSEGHHTMVVAARDGSGRIGANAALRHYYIDRTAPPVPAQPATTQANWTNGDSVSVTRQTVSDTTPAGLSCPYGVVANCVSGVARYDVRTRHSANPAAGWGEWSGWSTNINERAITTEGHTEVQYRAVDGAGNASSNSSTRLVRIDRTPPSKPTF